MTVIAALKDHETSAKTERPPSKRGEEMGAPNCPLARHFDHPQIKALNNLIARCTDSIKLQPLMAARNEVLAGLETKDIEAFKASLAAEGI